MNHYEVLGVAPDSPVEEIRRAYVDAARTSHPDFHEHGAAEAQQAAESRMRSINMAWAELKDPVRRARYDATVIAKRPEPNSTTPDSVDPAAWQPYDSTPAAPFDERHDRPITSSAVPTWLRLAPVLSFVVGLLGLVLGATTRVAALIAAGLALLGASLVLFVVAPLVALTSSRRGSRLPETGR